jgi:hypothetical protein
MSDGWPFLPYSAVRGALAQGVVGVAAGGALASWRACSKMVPEPQMGAFLRLVWRARLARAPNVRLLKPIAAIGRSAG